MPSVDFIFDDAAFQPLHNNGQHAAGLRAALLHLATASPSPSSQQPQASPSQSHAASHGCGLGQVLPLLLLAYQEHQRARLTAAATTHSRLQFELSTLPEPHGLQLMLLEPSRAGDAEKVRDRRTRVTCLYDTFTGVRGQHA